MYKFRKTVAEIPSSFSASNPGKSLKNTNTDRNAWRHSRRISARIFETNPKKVIRNKSRKDKSQTKLGVKSQDELRLKSSEELQEYQEKNSCRYSREHPRRNSARNPGKNSKINPGISFVTHTGRNSTRLPATISETYVGIP